jgi:hypothetical protein
MPNSVSRKKYILEGKKVNKQTAGNKVNKPTAAGFELFEREIFGAKNKTFQSNKVCSHDWQRQDRSWSLFPTLHEKNLLVIVFASVLMLSIRALAPDRKFWSRK